MGFDSKIEWTHHTFNPWLGCTKVSPACKFCYAEQFTNRYGMVNWGPNGERKKTSEQNWKKPYAWNRKAEKEGVRYRVFCASLADIFDDHESIKQEWRDALFKMIKETPNLDWLLLTKRPENYHKFLPSDWGVGYANVWLGISVENQQRANERMPILISTNAAIRFLSCEPLLGNIDFGYHTFEFINWVIIGGESGHLKDIRKLDLEHVKSVINQSKEYGIKVLFKQLGTLLAKELKLTDTKGGNFEEYPQHLDWLKIREYPK